MLFIKLFSIPGRIRLKAEGLKRNRSLALEIENKLSHMPFVSFIKANIKTGNILVIYDENQLDEVRLIDALQEEPKKGYISLRNKTKYHSMKLYASEISLVKRLLLLSLIAVSFRFMISLPFRAVGVLLLGFPFILFLTLYYFLKFTISALKRNRIYINNSYTVKKIQNLKRIIFHPEIVFADNHYKDMSYFEIESGIALGELKDPIKNEIRSLIKNFRNLGIIDIAILNNGENTGLIQYGKKSLGLDYSSNNENFEMLILGQYADSTNKKSTASDNRIIAVVSEVYQYHPVDIQCLEICDVPSLIKFCRSSNEYLTRAQIVNISIHIFGIMLSFTEYLHFSLLLLIYAVQALGNILYLRHNILNNLEEKMHGKQRGYSFA